jgi:hypothetical protein
MSLSGLVGSPSDRRSDQGLQRFDLRKCWPLDTRLSVDDHTFLQLSRHFRVQTIDQLRNPGRSLGRRRNLIHKDCETRVTVWVPRTRSPHATVHVFVDEAAESVSSKDADGRAGTWRAACGRSLIQ